MAKNDEGVVFDDCILLQETRNAYLFVIDDEEKWVLKSVCEWDPSVEDSSYGVVTLPEWFATKEGLA